MRMSVFDRTVSGVAMLVTFALLAACILLFATAAPALEPRKPSTAGAPRSRATVIAVLESGVNFLHEDFALAPGQAGKLPAAIPEVTTLEVPRAGSFDERVSRATAGPLGNLEPDRLYHVAGTRLLLYVPPDADDLPASNPLEDPVHGTGVASAAIGLEHGTNPRAFLVVVLADQPSEASWAWLSRSRWIDVVSTSYNNLYARPVPIFSCPEGRAITEIVAQGRAVFSAVGNGEQLGEVMSPSGHPDAYQVGGVDENGAPYVWGPTRKHRSTPNRPYETGDRYDFVTAASDSLDGEMVFGGTSGAAPSTAGRAADLIAFARQLLDSPRLTTQPLAVAGRRAIVPPRGPLADGDLTAPELVHLLHMVARPALPMSPSYPVEGYGALNGEAIVEAKAILSGEVELPQRPADDELNERAEETRRHLFPSQRCG